MVVRVAADAEICDRGWRALLRAAIQLGLEVVDCEFRNDDFEAMARLITYQPGSHNPVKLGQMFQKMCSERTHQAEKRGRWNLRGSVRNAVNYARAAALRTTTHSSH